MDNLLSISIYNLSKFICDIFSMNYLSVEKFNWKEIYVNLMLNTK